MKSGFVTLTHPISGGEIAVRAERVVSVEEVGDDNRLVTLDNEQSYMCKEEVDEIISAIDGALS